MRNFIISPSANCNIFFWIASDIILIIKFDEGIFGLFLFWVRVDLFFHFEDLLKLVAFELLVDLLDKGDSSIFLLFVSLHLIKLF